MAELDDKVIVTKDKITDIADTIRETGGTSARMTLDEMPDNIRAIGEGGGNVDAPLFVCIYPNTVTCNLTFAKIEEIYAGTGDTKASMPQLIYKHSSSSDNGTRSVSCDVTQYNEDTFIFTFDMGFGKGINKTEWQERIIEIQFERGDSLSKINDYTLEYQKPIVEGDGINITTQGTGINRKSQISVDSSMIMIGSASGSVASFSDGGANMLMKSCTVAIEPVQSGSGDPSPQNERPISGWTECNITIADDETTPTVSNVYNIEFPSEAGTVYGGTLDVTNGVLTVDRAIVDGGDLTWNYWTGDNFYADKQGKTALTNIDILCDCYPIGAVGTYGIYCIESSATQRRYIYICDSQYSHDSTGASQLKSDMTGHKICYRLATPQTYNLTPTEVKTLLGINNIFADCGDVDVEYVRDATLIINKLLELVSGNNNRTMMKSAVVEKTDEVQEQKKDSVEEDLDA
jgi:hypothetical protein